MNRTIARALYQDALYQVLDNRVFRLLAGLVLLLVLPTFVLGAREDSLVVLFGWREYFYEDIFAYFRLPYPGQSEAHATLIGLLQQIFVDAFAGSLGIMFCIAATAFFVPRMLEKGAADALFTKPVGRFTLLLARYASGLIFVALLASLLVGGIHVGLLLNSGYSDASFLWSIPILAYKFALLHAFSILVGVITRSTVAAILSTIIFFGFTAGVHQGWEVKERVQTEHADLAGLRDTHSENAETLDRFAYWGSLLLDAAHYVLPKTNDASLIAQKLRQSLTHEGPELYDSEADLTVLVAPQGFVRVENDLTGAGVVWRDERADATIRLTRRTPEGKEEFAGRYGADWVRKLVDGATNPLRAELEADPEVSALRLERRQRGAWREDGDWVDSERRIADRTTAVLSGRRAERAFEHAIFVDYPDWIFRLDTDVPAAALDDPGFQRRLTGFEASFQFEREHSQEGPRTWYERRFDWKAPLAYNIWFSILSSLAFVIAVLGLSGWRLARIDF